MGIGLVLLSLVPGIPLSGACIYNGPGVAHAEAALLCFLSSSLHVDTWSGMSRGEARRGSDSGKRKMPCVESGREKESKKEAVG